MAEYYIFVTIKHRHLYILSSPYKKCISQEELDVKIREKRVNSLTIQG